MQLDQDKQMKMASVVIVQGIQLIRAIWESTPEQAENLVYEVEDYLKLLGVLRNMVE